MIKHVYVTKGETVWRLPISAWLGVCKDAIGGGYALPDECVAQEGGEMDPDSLAIKITNWHKVDFEDFIRAYNAGNIKPPKLALIVEPVTKAEADKIVAEEKPKAKAPRKKK